jgi:hypothetical protein
LAERAVVVAEAVRPLWSVAVLTAVAVVVVVVVVSSAVVVVVDIEHTAVDSVVAAVVAFVR